MKAPLGTFVPALALAFAAQALTAPAALADDPMLDESVLFTGQIFSMAAGVPGVVIGAYRDGNTSVEGFGVTGEGGSEPDGDTVFRIGSITKVFAGEMLARAVADGQMGFTDSVTSHMTGDLATATADHPEMQMINLVTHSAGLPREAIEDWGPADDPFSVITEAAFTDWLTTHPLLFTPGSAIAYSNFGFDLLALGISNAAGAPYAELLQGSILDPLEMTHTGYELSDEMRANMMTGHLPDGTAMDVVPTGDMILGSGGLYSSANDLLKWLGWHLDRSAGEEEVRFLDHGVYMQREGKSTVLSMDESGYMDAMGLGWVVMNPTTEQPFVLQKAGALQGEMSYVAFAPERGTAVVITINQYNFTAAEGMAVTANALLAEISGY